MNESEKETIALIIGLSLFFACYSYAFYNYFHSEVKEKEFKVFDIQGIKSGNIIYPYNEEKMYIADDLPIEIIEGERYYIKYKIVSSKWSDKTYKILEIRRIS